MIVIHNENLRRIGKVVTLEVLIPALILLGVFVFPEKRYAWVSLGLTLLSLFVFITGYEKKKTGTRRLVLTAVMAALAVAGRLIPLLKPVAALVILTGIYLGGEAGFFMGALTAVVSNFYFGQGPWTPFQMAALGLIGLVSGGISEKLKNSRILLLAYGGAAGLFYSFFMDIWTVLWANGDFSVSLYGAALLSAIPFTLAYAVANVLFLWLLARPIGEKLERIHIKYEV